MKLIYQLFCLLGILVTIQARSKYIAIPLDNLQLFEVPDQDAHMNMPIIRVPRHALNNKPKFNGHYTQQPQAEASSHFEQANFSPQEYVDYGAHTGHHGAFGWYADFPVHKDN
ncbi:uncharacterized protein LOC135835867 [Planococcus citri]|uniref:uncharacterized protein LOC135835867 n=1 Tax=Planococcus citri TaxID=170843 RepID=UPI0031F8A50A